MQYVCFVVFFSLWVWAQLFFSTWSLATIMLPSTPISTLGAAQRMAYRCVDRLPKTKSHIFIKHCLSNFSVVHVPDGRVVSRNRQTIAFVMNYMKRKTIFLTNNFKVDGIRKQAMVLIHECYHLYSRQIVDIAYRFQYEKFYSLTKEQRKRNADSLAMRDMRGCFYYN